MKTLDWTLNSQGDNWGRSADGYHYLISVMNHGDEVVVSGDNQDGESVLFEPVRTVAQGIRRAEQHYAALSDTNGERQ